MRCRSLLFVPGDRPDRHAKALAAGADFVCIDLEDAVAPPAKDAARVVACDLLRNEPANAASVAIRVNDIKTQAGVRDLLALGEADTPPALLVLPKVRSAAEVEWARGVLDPRLPVRGIIAIIETVEALACAGAIARAGAAALIFGGTDLSAELGCRPEWEPLLYARSRVVHAAAGGGIPAIDVPLLDFQNTDRLQQDCRRARDLGFSGKAAIHPAQLAFIHAAFTPSAAETAWARRVLEASDQARGGVATLDGRMINAAVVRSARRILALAGTDANSRTG